MMSSAMTTMPSMPILTMTLPNGQQAPSGWVRRALRINQSLPGEKWNSTGEDFFLVINGDS
jgi:hypothetical protein